MFILVDPNSQPKPLDLSGVLKTFRSVDASSEATEIHTHLEEGKKEDPAFHEALENYRKASKHELKQIFHAEDIMTSPVVSVSGTTPLKDVLAIFEEKRFRHIPICYQDRLQNLISDRDVLKLQLEQAQKKGAFYEHPILNYVKPKEILCAKPKTAIRKIALLMLKKNIGCIPIMDDNNKLVGMVTRSDILRAIVKFGPIELWA